MNEAADAGAAAKIGKPMTKRPAQLRKCDSMCSDVVLQKYSVGCWECAGGEIYHSEVYEVILYL
jgi:hypothetical protein